MDKIAIRCGPMQPNPLHAKAVDEEMKNLLLMRHAKSDWSDSGMSDFDRPLNKRGRADAPRLAKLLRGSGLFPDFVLCSSALRARQTAELLLGADAGDRLQLDENLYLADPSTLTLALRSADTDGESGLVVAHNPGMEEWLRALCGCHVRMPTAAIACVQLDIGRWADTTDGCGQLHWFVTPRLLKSIL